MLSKIKSFGLKGISGYPVEVETYISNGIPSYEVVGQADKSVKESRERVKAAIRNSGWDYPVKRIVVNLSPGQLRKEGTSYDLPIAIGILVASSQIEIDEDMAFIGELALDGGVKGVCGILSMILAAKEKRIKRIFVPFENLCEASIIEGIKIFGVKSLTEAIFCIQTGNLHSFKPIPAKIHSVKTPDFREVNGHREAKRALEIAACGGHSILMMGSPGSGKTMLAKCLPGILPEMSYEEALETTMIHSISGRTKVDGLMKTRPFRALHHSCTVASLVGGGSSPRPGEITMAHNGVLFLDELPEFKRESLDALRQPLEDCYITITRLNTSVTYPAKFMLICAANPCRCGQLYEDEGCTCTYLQKTEYLHRISGPLLDRIDMKIQVSSVSYKEMGSKNTGEPSKIIYQRVLKAREVQERRYKNEDFFCNAWLPHSKFFNYCKMENNAEGLLELLYKKFKMSGREYTRIVRLSRTIADMEGKEIILPRHISEAAQFRLFNKGGIEDDNSTENLAIAFRA